MNSPILSEDDLPTNLDIFGTFLSGDLSIAGRVKISG